MISFNLFCSEGTEIAVLREESGKINLSESLRVLKNVSPDAAPEDVFLMKDFVPLRQSIIGKDASPVYWLKFKLRNVSASVDDWLLEYNFARSGIFIELYQPQEDGYTVTKDNPYIPYPRKDVPFRNPAFNVKLEPGQTKEYYIKMVVEDTAFLDFRVWNKDFFLSHVRKDQFFYGLFSGVVFIMLFYNLFLLFSFRDVSYLYYILFIFMLLVIQLNNHGLLSEIIPALQAYDVFLTDIAQSFAFVFFILFTGSYLSLKKHSPELRRMLMLAVGGVIFFFFLSLPVPSVKFAVNLFMIAGGVLAVASAVYLYIKEKCAHIFLYLLAVLTLVVSGILVSLPHETAHLIFSDFSYTMDISTLCLISFFAFGLAYRVRRIIKEKELYQQQVIEALEQADHLKDEFLANTSHELRTPLNHIIGFTASLIGGNFGDIPPRAVRRLKFIEKSGTRLLSLVDDILDLEKIKHAELEIQLREVDLPVVLTHVLTSFQQVIDERALTLKNNVSPGIPCLYMDENRLVQILYNLIGNAVKYTPSGTIEISCEVVPRFLRISIKDSGIGIPAHMREKIFDNFQRGSAPESEEWGGAGLGLSITRRLIELQGGRIEVDSHPGEGTCFTITLPVAEPGGTGIEAGNPLWQCLPLSMERPPAIETAPAEAEKKRILVVDDDSTNIQLLVDLLSSEGYSVLYAMNGEEALDLLRENEGPDLILLDIMMPGISGYEVCRRIREQRNLYEMPILMLTAKHQINDLVAGFECGANDFLVKPFKRPELLARVSTLCNLKNMTRTNTLLQGIISLKKQLINIAAHDLRHPLTFVLTYARRLKDRFSVERDEAKYLNSIIQAAQNMVSLIENFLEKPKVVDGSLRLNNEIIDLEAVLSDRMQHFHVMAQEKDQSLRFKQGETPSFFILGDREYLPQIIDNLLDNAIKYSPRGKEIIVSLDRVEAFVRLCVQDAGPGLSEEDRRKLFREHHKGSAKPTGGEKSSGLGLMLTSLLVELHKGRIYAESEQGKGAVFYVEFHEAPACADTMWLPPQGTNL